MNYCLAIKLSKLRKLNRDQISQMFLLKVLGDE